MNEMTANRERSVALVKKTALKDAQRSLERSVKEVVNEPWFPWRDRPEDFVDRVAATKQALREITNEIIDLEIELRDPEQYEEMKYEIEAAIAFSGNRNDRAELYLHTDEQERQFQAQIHDQVEYGYYDQEDGWVDGISERPNVGTCPVCNTSGVWFEDEGDYIDGYVCCNNCMQEVLCWFYFLAWITVTHVRTGRYDSEPSFDDAFIALDGNWYQLEEFYFRRSKMGRRESYIAVLDLDGEVVWAPENDDE